MELDGAEIIRGDEAMRGGGVSNRWWAHERDLQGHQRGWGEQPTMYIIYNGASGRNTVYDNNEFMHDCEFFMCSQLAIVLLFVGVA